MGYDLARIVSEIDAEFLCCICEKVLENAVQSPCEHTFCNVCIKEWLNSKDHCPKDKNDLAFEDLRPTASYFRNLLNKVEIRCDIGGLS